MNLWFLFYVFVACQLIIVTTSMRVAQERRGDMFGTLVEGVVLLFIYSLMALAVVVIEPEQISDGSRPLLMFLYITSRIVAIGGGVLATIIFIETISKLIRRGTYDLDSED